MPFEVNVDDSVICFSCGNRLTISVIQILERIAKIRERERQDKTALRV